MKGPQRELSSHGSEKSQDSMNLLCWCSKHNVAKDESDSHVSTSGMPRSALCGTVYEPQDLLTAKGKYSIYKLISAHKPQAEAQSSHHSCPTSRRQSVQL